MTHPPSVQTWRLAVGTGKRAAAGEFDVAFHPRKRGECIKSDRVVDRDGGGAAASDPRDLRILSLSRFKSGKKTRKGPFSFADHDIIRDLSDLFWAGRGVRAADYRDLLCGADLVDIFGIVKTIQTITDHIPAVSGGIDRLENVSVFFGRGIQGSIGVSGRCDETPGCPHYAKETVPLVPSTVTTPSVGRTPFRRSIVGISAMIAPVAMIVSHSVLMIAAGAAWFFARAYKT